MQINFLSKTKIPRNLPPGMQQAVEYLRKLKGQKQCLAKAYRMIAKKYRGYHFMTYTRPLPIFSFNVEKLWNSRRFMHCHNMNYLMRILLVKSGFFDNEDIENRWTLVWYISPHQYLRVKMNDGRCVNVDTWGASNGIKFGGYSHGFK